MTTCGYPDIHGWIQSLPSTNQWKSNTISVMICSSTTTRPSLNFCVTKIQDAPANITFSIVADFNLPIALWSSKPIKTNSKSSKLLDDEGVPCMVIDLIENVLNYTPNKCNNSIKVPKLDSLYNLKNIFNLTFFTLSFLICIYEAPGDLRSGCLVCIKDQLTAKDLREASKLLMQRIGSNLEEQWMRSVNLGITNWIVELQVTHRTLLKTPSPLFSYSFSTSGLWKLQLYCPVIAMEVESLSNSSADERLLFSLKYQQLEGVIQFNYRVAVQEKWIDVIVNIDNIRCDVFHLLNSTVMNERGVGINEKHFPSRVSLHLTPIQQANIISVSVGKSSENPTRAIEVEKGIEASFEPPNKFGVQLTAGETVSTSLKPWKFEESVYGYSSTLNWFLHDSVDGREVFSSKPSKMALINPRSWIKDRYMSAYRPFTRQGGVIFAGDEYGNSVRWKVDKSALGKTIDWEVKGWIWLTYWPNKYKTFYTETRRLEFREIVHLTIA